MSQTKVQLIQPVGIMTAPGVNVSGTLTATTFDGNLVGAAGSIIGTPNVNVGIVTAVSFYGNGENLTGVAGSTFIGVVTAAQSGTTTIDLSLGNIIYFTQDTNTTVAFANTESTQVVDFIRDKDATTTARTITWPESIIWNGGTAPTLIDSSQPGEVQIFKLITRDQGVTWYGYEPMKNDPSEPIKLLLWGFNDSGQLAQNDRVTRSSPIQVPGTNWDYFSIGSGSGESVGVIKTDGTLWVWGENGGGGALGLNDQVSRSSPVQIPGTEWSRVQMNRYTSSFGTKTDGTLWAWGDNTLGQLGQSDTTQFSSPKQIPGTQWDYESLSANYGSAFCKKTDGSFWAWGYNYYGDLGYNDRVWRSSPIQIPGTGWATIKAIYGWCLATKTDGSLWTWGNLQGLQNSGSGSDRRSSPTQIPGTSWNTGEFALGGDRYVSRALKTDGSLWTWGFNGNGQLGQNDVTHYSSPTQIPGTWKAVNVSGSGNQSYVGGLCTKTDGSLWSWGGNNYGRLGLDDTVPRSSPQQIPGTGWKDNLCTGTASGAIQQ